MGVVGERIYNGIVKENPIFVQVLAMCPTLAVTTSATNGIGMGLAATAVLMASNALISLLRKVIPDKVRIPAYIVIIAGLVTLLDLLMKGFSPALSKSLGIFIPLIVVNCVILGRAEAYANKSGVIASIFDGLGMGLGFTVALTVLGVIRELLGVGKVFGMQIMPPSYQPALIMILAPGAFFTLGILMALLNVRRLKKEGK
ncbi:electron transport complex subunit RnfE [Clostridium acetireducens DSM 10703]|jgi:electron transport complex protein RnfE|uniref:Ion-translocating oxidoreductase complex subunit E n=1 Tax=Clostridium acetireducens DSM 10703 TaxID=1121290 RepID=A0A1E8EY03_9CLOT|nr:electron transport complex subunit E [Clostridium acetireducens]OFI05828.1 electron transport complex subunit RnfE [Clostridium acetireducens DSM 10703]